ncbi:unnamed protein product [Polarella glacialis]|uniref:Uncharacterized protein n=1 Tax=Polarella glacialis TaxID=89957 RepID=A0A813I609_POLGL|nr:unnamed protein product [Polarella glacialis]
MGQYVVVIDKGEGAECPRFLDSHPDFCKHARSEHSLFAMEVVGAVDFTGFASEKRVSAKSKAFARAKAKAKANAIAVDAQMDTPTRRARGRAKIPSKTTGAPKAKSKKGKASTEICSPCTPPCKPQPVTPSDFVAQCDSCGLWRSIDEALHKKAQKDTYVFLCERIGLKCRTK